MIIIFIEDVNFTDKWFTKESSISFKLFWYKVFVHWELKLLNFLVDSALSYLAQKMQDIIGTHPKIQFFVQWSCYKSSTSTWLFFVYPGEGKTVVVREELLGAKERTNNKLLKPIYGVNTMIWMMMGGKCIHH